MLKHHISSPEDFARLSEETERLVQHVEDVRQRMAAAAKKRQSRPDIQVVPAIPAEPAQTPSKPEQSSRAREAREAETRPPSSPPPPSSSAPASSAPSTRRPDSGIFPVMRDREAGRYCFVADRKTPLDALLPAVASRPASRKIPA
jgi:hypothetical protein